ARSKICAPRPARAALPRAQEHSAHGPVHPNGARPVQGLLEGGGQDPQPDVAVERTDPSRRTKTKTESPPGEVTSRAITRPVDFSLCAPSGRPRCRPPASVGWACA